MNTETIYQIIQRVWGDRWNKLPIDYKINLRYNYQRTIANRRKLWVKQNKSEL